MVVGLILAVQNNLLMSKPHTSNSSSARGSQSIPLNCDDFPLLIQEVIQLLIRRSSPGHSKQLFMEILWTSPPQPAIWRLQPPCEQYTAYKRYSWSSTASRSSPLRRLSSLTEYPVATWPVPNKWAICYICYWFIANYSTIYVYIYTNAYVVGLIAKQSAMHVANTEL